MLTVKQLICDLEGAIEKGVDPQTPVRVLNDVFTEEPIVDLGQIHYRNRFGGGIRDLKNTYEIVLMGVEDDGTE